MSYYVLQGKLKWTQYKILQICRMKYGKNIRYVKDIHHYFESGILIQVFDNLLSKTLTRQVHKWLIIGSRTMVDTAAPHWIDVSTCEYTEDNLCTLMNRNPFIYAESRGAVNILKLITWGIIFFTSSGGQFRWLTDRRGVAFRNEQSGLRKLWNLHVCYD